MTVKADAAKPINNNLLLILVYVNSLQKDIIPL